MDFRNRTTQAHFLPTANRETALAALAYFMNDDRYLEWLCSISEFDYPESEHADLPERFRELYIFNAPRPYDTESG